jgi:hypothetical protein
LRERVLERLGREEMSRTGMLKYSFRRCWKGWGVRYFLKWNGEILFLQGVGKEIFLEMER